MINVTLKQLRYFEALAQHGHFGQAANACAISQPALSVQIRDLELELGQPLVERGARQVRLTAFGENVLERASAILRQTEELGDFSRSASGSMMDRLRLGIIPTIAPYLLPRLIGNLAAEFPGLEVSVRETVTPRLIEELHASRIDAALVALPVSEPGLTEMPLFDESFVLVRHQSEANRPVPDGEALAQMRLLLLEEGHCFRDAALSFCQIGSAMPRDGLDGSSLTTLVQMVGVGLGVTLIPEMAVSVETQSAPVAVTRFEAPQPSRSIGFVWRKASPLAEQFARIADVAKEVGLAQQETAAL